MSKILTIIVFSFFFFYGCGEDCPVNTDERIIKLEEPCLEYEEFTAGIFPYMSALNSGLYLEVKDHSYLESNIFLNEILLNTERNPLTNIKFRIRTKTDKIIEINCDGEFITKRVQHSGFYQPGYYKYQINQYSPFVTQYNFKKIVLLDDVEYEIYYFCMYYFTKDYGNYPKLVLEKFDLEFKATDKELENDRKKVTEVTNKYFDKEYNYIDILSTYKVCK